MGNNSLPPNPLRFRIFRASVIRSVFRIADLSVSHIGFQDSSPIYPSHVRVIRGSSLSPRLRRSGNRRSPGFRCVWQIFSFFYILLLTRIKCVSYNHRS